MDVLANNIANTNTPGYKTEHVLFSDWLLHVGAGAEGGARGADVAFAQDRATWHDQSPGTITHTGEPLDLAIGGDGFFSVSTANGVRLTRAGRFTLAADGTITDSVGNAVLDDGGSPIVLADKGAHLTVAGDGTLSGDQGVIAKIGVVSADGNHLFAEGANLFRAETATAAVPRPGIVQGGVESSNVSPMLEMTSMMQLGREFQFTAQFARAEADRQQSAIDKLSAEPQA